MPKFLSAICGFFYFKESVMSKNLTFKLILDGDSKGLASATKDAQNIAAKFFDSIKDEAQKLRQESEKTAKEVGQIIPDDLVQKGKQAEAAIDAATEAIRDLGDQAQKTSDDVDGLSEDVNDIVPSAIQQKIAKLVSELHLATKSLDEMGDTAELSAENLKMIGDYGHTSLEQLEQDLKDARAHLNYLKATQATPEDIDRAQKEVSELETGFKQVKMAVEYYESGLKRATSTTDQLATEVDDTTKSVDKLGKETTETASQIEKADGKTVTFSKGVDNAKFAVGALSSALAALGVGLGIRELAQTADSYTNLSTRIQIATREQGNFTEAIAGVHQVALMTNSSLSATADLFTRLNTVGKEMGMTQQQALELTKTVTQAIQIGGGSAQASEAAVTQFIQAMQGGVLRGEEFNSIMENGFGLAEALAKGLGVTTGELRKMAEAGELSAERVVKAIGSQSAQIQELYNQFPTTISNALQKISTSWEILIGKMDQANGASATVADWLSTLADNIYIVENLINDLGDGFVWVGDQLKKIDPQTIDALKNALITTYDAIKELGVTVGGAFEISIDVINTALGAIFNFNNGIRDVETNTNGITKALQVLNVVIGYIGDGFNAIGIVANLLTGVIYDVGAAFVQLKSKVLWGDAKTQAIADMDEMARKAQEYYQKASDGALEFQSKGIQAYEAISVSQEQANAKSLAEAKATMDQLLAEQQREVEGKKVTEEEKLNAVKTYAEQAIAANQGVMDGVMQADLMTKGYIVTLDSLGKVSVDVWQQQKEAIEGVANAGDQARKAAAALELDLDQSLNRVSAKFKETEANVNKFALGLEELGIAGEDAANVTYEAWLKWLETAKSQSEIDFAKSKLEEFGEQGQISTSLVEQGLIAVKNQAQQIPDAIDPITEAFKRLGIQTKEQLKLSAQMALADFETVRQSGQATQADLQKAYEKTIQMAYASGDAQSIAAANAKAASLGLAVQVDETGKASVKSMDELEQKMHRVHDSTGYAENGFRRLRDTAVDTAQEAGSAWEQAVAKASAEFDASMKQQAKALGSLDDYESYSRDDVIQQLKSRGYSDDKARSLASSIWSQAMAADRDAKLSGMGKGGIGGLDKLVAQEFDRAAARAVTTQHGTNKINELLSSINIASTGYTPPSLPTPISTASTAKTVNYQFQFGGKTLSLAGTPEQEPLLNQLVQELQKQAKIT